MKRRDFLKKVGIGTAAAVGASAVSAPAVLAQKKFQWKIHHPMDCGPQNAYA